MALNQQTLQVIGVLSTELASAQSADDTERLAAIVVACRTVEQRALAHLADRVEPVDLVNAQALVELGW